MKHFVSVLALSAVGILSTDVILHSLPQNDEQELKKVITEWAAHLGTSPEDIAVQKRCLDEKFTTKDVMGLLAEVTHADIGAWPKSEPNVKGSAEVRDIKVRFDSPDLAIVTYAGTYTTTGHKDKRDDYKAEFVSIDTLRKKNGQWKVLADANTSTEPVAASLYKVAP